MFLYIHITQSKQLGMTLHEHLDRFCHFYRPFNRSVIIPPFLHTMSVPFNRYIIGSAVFVYHSIGLYSMCVIGSAHLICHSAIFAYHSIGLSSIPPFLRTIQLVYTACSLCKKLIYRTGSAVFTHHSICLSSVPPFLRTIQ